MVGGLIALLCDLYSGVTPAEVIATEPEVWQRCGFMKLLSPTRINGLAAVRERLKGLASGWS
jgi:cysteine desulfuration protein SufE